METMGGHGERPQLQEEPGASAVLRALQAQVPGRTRQRRELLLRRMLVGGTSVPTDGTRGRGAGGSRCLRGGIGCRGRCCSGQSTSGGSAITLDVEEMFTVGMLKALVQEKMGIRIGQQRLIFAGDVYFRHANAVQNDLPKQNIEAPTNI